MIHLFRSKECECLTFNTEFSYQRVFVIKHDDCHHVSNSVVANINIGVELVPPGAVCVSPSY